MEGSIPFEWIISLRFKLLRNYLPLFSCWHKICSLKVSTSEKVAFVNIMVIKELASANLLLVLVIILVGFGVIKIVKKRYED